MKPVTVAALNGVQGRLDGECPRAVDGASASHLAKVCSAGADTLAIATAMTLAFPVSSLVGEGGEWRWRHAMLAFASLPLWVASFAQARLYVARHVAGRVDELRRITSASTRGVVATLAVGYMAKIHSGRTWFFVTFLLSVAFVGAEREVARRVFARLRRHGRLARRVAIVGHNLEGDALAQMLAKDPELGYEVVGFVDNRLIDDNVVGRFSNVTEVLQGLGATGVIIAATALDHVTINRLCRVLPDNGIHVELSSSLRDVATQRLSMRMLGRFPVTYIEPVRRHGWRSRAKRAYDIIVASFGLLVTAPLLGLIAIAIMLDSRGSVIFRHQRIGRHGVSFKVLKFRTMVSNAAALPTVEFTDPGDWANQFKPRHDPRITRVGAFLRRTSLDELPQLWNVLKGEMSIVGPRPAVAKEIEMWGDDAASRLRVQPGITGMWQVGRGPDWCWDDFVRLDLYYVDNWSLLTDLAISFRTIPMLLSARGNR